METQRVFLHHATNRQYRDRNFGGALIVWDRDPREREQQVKQNEQLIRLVAAVALLSKRKGTR